MKRDEHLIALALILACRAANTADSAHEDAAELDSEARKFIVNAVVDEVSTFQLDSAIALLEAARKAKE